MRTSLLKARTKPSLGVSVICQSVLESGLHMHMLLKHNIFACGDGVFCPVSAVLHPSVAVHIHHHTLYTVCEE